MRRLLLIAALILAAGCSATARQSDQALIRSDEAMTRPLGQGPAFRPGPLGNRAVAAGLPVGRWRCSSQRAPEYGAHIELFAENHEVLVPAGIGIAAPQKRSGAYVTAGRCEYPLRTVDPTGVVRIERAPGPAPTVGDLFKLWGQPLSSNRLVAFTGPVSAFVAGRPWSGDPRAIRLKPHAQIVLELATRVIPHRFYLFPDHL